MIKVKVTKNIMSNGTVMMGLTKTQIIAVIVSIAVSALIIVLLHDKMSFDGIMMIVFLEIILIMGFVVVKIQGMTLFKFLILCLKGTDVRKYNSKGVYSGDEDVF